MESLNISIFAHSLGICSFTLLILQVNTLRFCIPAQPPCYTWDPTKLVLAVDVKVTNSKKDGPPPFGSEVSWVNNTLLSLIKTARLSFNNHVVSHISDYSIVNYINARLNNNDEDMNSYLQVGISIRLDMYFTYILCIFSSGGQFL